MDSPLRISTFLYIGSAETLPRDLLILFLIIFTCYQNIIINKQYQQSTNKITMNITAELCLASCYVL